MSIVKRIQEIKGDIPHRYPFMFIDRVIEFESGKSILALKNVTCNEDFFNGHFPQRPIMPGVITIEALSQAAGLLIFYTTNTRVDESSGWYFLAGVDNARFRRVVEPGDQMRLYVEIKKRRRDLWVFDAKASVDGELACSAELLLAKGALK